MQTYSTRMSHPKYRPDIDGLRAIAVLSVIGFHAFPYWVKGGFIGVDVFFVISGFLISTIIFESLEKNTFSFSEFYARRIKRIFPALLLVLIACYAVGWFILLAGEYKQLGKHIAGGAGFVSNLILWGEAGYFDNSAETKPLLHLWSLGIEEQFYIAWPLLLWFAWKKNFNLLSMTIIVAVVSFYLNIKGVNNNAVATFYSPQTRFWELLCGSILAWMILYKKDTLTFVKRKLEGWLGSVFYQHAPEESDGKTLANILGFAGLLLLTYGFYGITKDFSFPGMWAIVPVLGSVLVISAGPYAWFNRVVLSNRLLVWFGLISFPLYLWHWPLLSFARIVENEVPGKGIRIAAILISIVLAWLTYRLLEKPMRFGKHGSVKTFTLVVLMFAMGYVGYDTYRWDGFGFRHTSNLSMDEKAIAEERSNYWADNLDKNFENSKTKVLIYGDSQGFDLFKALRNDDGIGVKIFQVDHDCTSFNLLKVNLEKKSQKCRDSFDKLTNSNDLKQADVLVYAIHWVKNAEPPSSKENYKLALEKIKAINPNIKIAFFGPKPLLGKEWVSINVIMKTQKSIFGINDFLNKIKWIRDTDAQYVSALAEDLNVKYIDVNDIFCSGGCQFHMDKQFTHFDQNHWSEFGARLFFNKLSNTEEYRDLIRRTD